MSNKIEAEGVIHGKTIELAVDPGLEDGQRVRVQVMVRPVADPDDPTRGDPEDRRLDGRRPGV